MTDLPDGWTETRLRDVLAAPLTNGRSVKDQVGGFPVLRLNAVGNRAVDLAQCKTGAWTASEAARFLVARDDFLVIRGNGSLFKVGAGGLVGDVQTPVAYPDTLIRVRLNEGQVLPRYIALLWSSHHVRLQIEGVARTTAGIYKINQGDLLTIRLPLPPLAEQHRIVGILESSLSRLDAAGHVVRTFDRRKRTTIRSILSQAIPDLINYPAHWVRSTVGVAGSVELGRQRHPDWHHGDRMFPYLRVANVMEDRIDITDLKEMHWPGDTFERFRLHPGDVLLNEGQSPEWLGRPALYRGAPAAVAFTNSIIRFQAHANVDPEFALLVFRRHMHLGRFRRESRITTNIAHLSAARLKGVEFPIPPLEEQRQTVARANQQFEALDNLGRGVETTSRRSTALRRALLDAAFSGRLTGRDSDLDRAEEAIA